MLWWGRGIWLTLADELGNQSISASNLVLPRGRRFGAALTDGIDGTDARAVLERNLRRQHVDLVAQRDVHLLHAAQFRFESEAHRSLERFFAFRLANQSLVRCMNGTQFLFKLLC